MQVVQAGESSLPSATLPASLSGSDAQRSSSTGNNAQVGGGCISAMSATMASHGSTAVVPAENPFFLSQVGQWPPWSHVQALPSSFSGGADIGISPVAAAGIIQNSGNCAVKNITSAGVGRQTQALTLAGVSKKTAQRQQQRLAKKNFKIQSANYPMIVPATLKGEIDPSIRLSVHRLIRASASKYLKLPVIKFRDHPCEHLRNLKEDLDKRFIFDSNLKQNYVLSFIEKTMKNVRYVFHRHWLDTGRGLKHEDCSEKDFAKLVKYWKSKEAEQEIREQKAEREAERERLRTAMAKVTEASEVSDDRWIVSRFKSPATMLACG